MNERDQRIYEEAAALWRTLYRDPPPDPGAGADLLDIITRDLRAPDYERLASPHMRPSIVSFPKRG